MTSAARVFNAVPLVFRSSGFMSAIGERAAGEKLLYADFKFVAGLPSRYHEAGCGWVSYLAERLDLEYRNRPSQAPLVKRLPSEHLKSGRIFFHTELGEHGLRRALAGRGPPDLQIEAEMSVDHRTDDPQHAIEHSDAERGPCNPQQASLGHQQPEDRGRPRPD